MTIRVDPDTGGSNSRNGLIKFDLAAVPAGATITAATLHLHTANGGGGGPEVSFYVMNQPWTGAATWRESGLGAWLTNGANPPSRGTTVIATLPASADETPYAVALPVPVVQAWVTDPASNEGLAMVVETADTDDVYLRSANNETTGDRPELELTWLPAE